MSRQEDRERCCGTCQYHEHERIDDEWVCTNPDSYYCTDWTEYKDSCSFWEDKNECNR